MKTLTTQVDNARYDDGVHLVWRVESIVDTIQGSTLANSNGQLLLYASRAYTVQDSLNNIYTYSDSLDARRGIDFGQSTLRPKGGLASVASGTVRLRNEELLSLLDETYVLSNDEFAFYLSFHDNTEDYEDRVELTRGIVDTHRSSGGVWEIRIKDASKTQIQLFPSLLLTPINYPFAYDFGAVLPISFGNLNNGPHDRTTASVDMAPIIMTDKFAIEGSSGNYTHTFGDVYQWYSSANKYARVSNPSRTGNTVDVSDPLRDMRIKPVRSHPSNTTTRWYDAATGSDDVGVSLVSGDVLRVYTGSAPKLGDMDQISVYIHSSTGTYDYKVYNASTQVASGTGVSGDTDEVLTLSLYDDWQFALLNVEVTSSTGATIDDIELRVRFYDFLAFQETPPKLFEEAQGFKDETANYNDGGLITGSQGTVLRNPVHILQAILRGKDLLNLPVSKIKNGWTEAAAVRTSWKFDFSMSKQLDDNFLDEFCFQSGLHLFPEEGGWSVAAMDVDREPAAYIDGDWDMPVSGQLDRPDTWSYQFDVSPAPISETINEVALRFDRRGETDTYDDVEIASGRYRFEGTCALNNADGNNEGDLYDQSGDFLNKNIQVGETVYVEGNRAYKVTQVQTANTIIVESFDGSPVLASGTGTRYWIGPNLDEQAIYSQLVFKTVSALGGQAQDTAFVDSGYETDLIRDRTTAETFAQHTLDWFSQPRDIYRFPVFHTHCNLSLGDMILIDHAEMKTSLRPVLRGTVTSAVTTNAVSIEVAENGIYTAGDYLLFRDSDNKPEIMKVTSLGPNSTTLNVSRAQYNTVALQHDNGASIRHLNLKWMVRGIKPPTPNNPFYLIEVEQTPSYYTKIGIVSNLSTTYAQSSITDRSNSGFVTYPNGRLIPADRSTTVSKVGT